MVIIDGNDIKLEPATTEKIAQKMRELSVVVAEALGADPTAGVYSMYVSYPAVEQARA